MSKKPIDFSAIDTKVIEQLKKFVATRVAIAKEDARHKEVLKPLLLKLEAIQEKREVNLNAGMSTDDVIRQFPTLEVDKAIRKENNLHKENLKPLNDTLKGTYSFVPENLYDGYKLKIEKGKRGEFMQAIKTFLLNLGIKNEDVSQSALGKLAERISDYLGVTVSNNKTLLKDGVLSNVMRSGQFNKLFMSIFCDILAQNDVIIIDVK